MIELRKDEYVITAFADPAFSHGWSNNLVLVIIGDSNGGVRTEAIQPEYQTVAMIALFGVSAAAHHAMTKAVESAMKKGNSDD